MFPEPLELPVSPELPVLLELLFAELLCVFLAGVDVDARLEPELSGDPLAVLSVDPLAWFEPLDPLVELLSAELLLLELFCVPLAGVDVDARLELELLVVPADLVEDDFSELLLLGVECVLEDESLAAGELSEGGLDATVVGCSCTVGVTSPPLWTLASLVAGAVGGVTVALSVAVLWCVVL